MKNYKLVIQYDGNAYKGWQRQGNTNNTVQGRLEKIISRLLDVQSVEIIGSGRTDAGVHALCQVANFHGHTSKSPDEIRKYINTYLPADILVRSCEEVEECFHSRLHAISKKYLYIIDNGTWPDIFQRQYSFRVEEHLDVGKMKRAAALLLGEHDFCAFCSNQRTKKSTVRTLYSIEIQQENGKVKLLLHGNGFLYNMVRILVGTLIEVGSGKREVESMIPLLSGAKREAAGFTAPGKGLFLMDVLYKK